MRKHTFDVGIENSCNKQTYSMEPNMYAMNGNMRVKCTRAKEREYSFSLYLSVVRER